MHAGYGIYLIQDGSHTYIIYIKQYEQKQEAEAQKASSVFVSAAQISTEHLTAPSV